MTGYKDLNDLYNQNETKDPDSILEEIRSFFSLQGSLFRDGLISEDEFYLNTNPSPLFLDLWKRKNNMIVKQNRLFRNNEFLDSFLEWKKTGKCSEKQWMKDAIVSDGSIGDSVNWLFRVIDGLKVPLTSFKVIDIDAEKAPDIIIKVGKDYIHPLLFDPDLSMESLLNMASLICEKDPVGKSFTFSFPGIGTKAEVTVRKKENNNFYCIGMIEKYMHEPGEILITPSENGNDCFYFGKTAVSPLQALWGTYFLPLPVSEWQEYEQKRLERAYNYEAEYKTLRLPYLLGKE